MKRIYTLLFALVLMTAKANAQALPLPKPHVSGMYVQYGYNLDWYTHSDLHFDKDGQYSLTFKKASAKDRDDFKSIGQDPIQISIPQYSYRIGIWMNKQHTWAIEVNFDHAKYIVQDDRTMRVTGNLNGRYIDKDTFVSRDFMHFEHSDGANFLHLNYVGQTPIARVHGDRILATFLYKVGGGIVIPKTDVTLFGKELDNKFHVAGYIGSAELGFRFYPIRNLFIEATAKGGYANYVNALGSESGAKVRHHFFYGSTVATLGYDINFHKQPRRRRERLDDEDNYNTNNNYR